MAQTTALIVAAGRGLRVGGETPKQYLNLGGQPVLRRTVQAFVDHDAVDGVLCVIHPDDRALYDEAVAGLDLPDPVHGGETRQDSVRNGLEAISAANSDRVLIHDAARPFIRKQVISGVLEALADHPGAIPALPVADTLKRGADGLIDGTQSRDGLYRAQTPQGFRFDDILEAHTALAGQNLTDDAALFEERGLNVALTVGDEDNFKITTGDDLMRAERLLACQPTRTGFGYDVHAFSDGDHVTLCGVEISHSHALAGHSDADVALHALTDALLGAIGAGDIGHHFPPSDSQWKGVSSAVFLKHARDLIANQGGEITNVDITIICEEPKIGPHRDAMTAKVAQILTIDPSRASVKATTTEGLGFTGRGEGIAAQAVATVRIA